MDFSLDDEQQLIVATIARFVDKDIGAWAGDADREAKPPQRLHEVAGEVGFLVDAVPAEADGLLEGEFCHLTRALRSIELGRGCSAMAALLETNVEPCLATTAWGSEAAKESLFISITKGGMATTWSDFWGRLTVSADDEGLTIDGAIGPVPAMAGASHVLVCGRIGGAGGEPFLALLATANAGIKPQTPSGWRCARWGTAHCTQTRIPNDHVLARGSDATARINQVLSWYRVNLAARAVGVSIAAMKHAAGYAEERVQFGRPIGTFESLVRLRDRSETAAAAARLLVLEAAAKLDAGAADAVDAASRARDFAGDVVSRATIDAVQIYGGYGFVNDYPVEKLMRDARAYEALLGNEAVGRAVAGRADAQ
jgi:alkylation response protein AidB-like acyl-CoA dehydrogenase